MKLAEVSGIKKEHLKAKIEKFENDSKNKNIRDLNKSINDFKKGYQPRTNVVKDERVIWLRTPTIFWLGGGNISLCCPMCMG